MKGLAIFGVKLFSVLCISTFWYFWIGVNLRSIKIDQHGHKIPYDLTLREYYSLNNLGDWSFDTFLALTITGLMAHATCDIVRDIELDNL